MKLPIMDMLSFILNILYTSFIFRTSVEGSNCMASPERIQLICQFRRAFWFQNKTFMDSILKGMDFPIIVIKNPKHAVSILGVNRFAI